ncbi:MAG: acyl-CoA dehydrogenase family protein [Vicinamibacterales bacterium]
MNLDLTDEHRLLEGSVREWASQAVAPRIRDLDRAHQFDRNLLPQMAELGLLGVCIPPAYGGAGMDYLSLGLACEELEAVDTSLRVILSVHVALNSLTLLTWGTEDQKARYLVPQAQGTRVATFGLTEPAAGSDVRGLQSVAVRRGGTWVITGEKTWISLDEVEVPDANLLGQPGEGFKIAMFALDQGRYSVAAGATGLIRACRDASAAYALDRKTFGIEIAQHQLVKEMIARMEADYQVSRLLWMRCGWLKNEGRRCSREASLAKWVSTTASERAAGDAVQVHGANGYSDDYPVGRYYRNCKGAVIYEGTREIHALMQADYVLGYRTDRPTRCALPPWPGPAPAEA